MGIEGEIKRAGIPSDSGPLLGLVLVYEQPLNTNGVLVRSTSAEPLEVSVGVASCTSAVVLHPSATPSSVYMANPVPGFNIVPLLDHAPTFGAATGRLIPKFAHSVPLGHAGDAGIGVLDVIRLATPLVSASAGIGIV